MAFQKFFKFILHLIDGACLYHPFLKQFLFVNFAGIRVFRDGFIEQGLGKSGLITLVVTILSVAQQVYEHILLEFLAVLHSELQAVHHGFHIIRIYMKHWRKRNLGHVCTVGAGAGVEVIGGEAHLIIHNNMYSTSCPVTLELGHLNDLVDHALPCNSRIAMN